MRSLLCLALPLAARGGTPCRATRESCDALLASRIADSHTRPDCPQWASQGECAANPDFMEETCCASCLRRGCMLLDHDPLAASLLRSAQHVPPADDPEPRSGTDEGERIRVAVRDAGFTSNPFGTGEEDPCPASDEEQSYGEISRAGMDALLRSMRHDSALGCGEPCPTDRRSSQTCLQKAHVRLSCARSRCEQHLLRHRQWPRPARLVRSALGT